ncbi:hypothetical protein HK097_009881 [Rhizophlyctis rosea]|uniref:V-SNARE coiled-coil homology domain-containing protein n=1 Tax=Rhizophlyctis rosea TaxID=64517 RepID=A0AAD5X469_9FUNG|nr:hypothetical protein HK097_009881 [Rhizophlyctis rosea]
MDKITRDFLDPYVLATSSDVKLSLLNSQLVPNSPEWFYLSILHELNAVRDDPEYLNEHLRRSETLIEEFRKLDHTSDAYLTLHNRYLLLKAEVNKDWTEALVHFESQFQLEQNEKDHHPPPDVDLGIRPGVSQDPATQAPPPTSLDEQVLEADTLLKNSFKAFEKSAYQSNSSALTARSIVYAASTLLAGNHNWDETVALNAILSKVVHSASLRTNDGQDLLPQLLARQWSVLRGKPPHVPSFHNLPCRHLLTARQLEQLESSCPGLKNDSNYIAARVRTLLPIRPEDLKSDSAELAAIRSYIESCLSYMPKDFAKVKARILFTLMVKLRQEAARYDRSLLLEYLEIPMEQQWRIFTGRRKSTTFPIHGTYSDILPIQYFPTPDQYFIRDSMVGLFRNGIVTDYKTFAPYFDEKYLRDIFYETMVVSADDHAEWTQYLASYQLLSLSESVVLELPTESNPETIDPSDSSPVQLSLRLKNVTSLVVQVFEVNTFAFHRDHGDTKGALGKLDVSGLVPNREERFTFTESPFKLWDKQFEVVEAKAKRGIWIVEFLGGGQKVRAVVRKGHLKFLERITHEGHVMTLIDESNARVPGRIWMSGHFFEPDEEGDFLIPFTGASTSFETLLLTHDGFTHRYDRFQHLAEDYTLSANFHGLPESIVCGNKCDVVVRATLHCNDVQVPLNLLKDIKLTVETRDLDNVQNIKVVENFGVTDTKDGVYSFLVAESLQSIQFRLDAKVRVESKKTDRDLSFSSELLEVNKIQMGNGVASLFLQRARDGWRVAVLGKNGEPRADQDVFLQLQHKFFQEPVRLTLRTDQKGLVQLGKLENITNIQAVSTDGAATWDIAAADATLKVPNSLVIAEGTPVRLPYPATLPQLQRHEWCLLRYGGPNASTFIDDISEQVSFEIDNDSSSRGSGVITLPLPHGKYLFQYLDIQNFVRSIGITVVKSEVEDPSTLAHWRLQTVVSKRSVHRLSSVQDSTLPLRIISAAPAETQSGKVKIKIEGVVHGSTRVHAFVSTFVQGTQDAPRIVAEVGRESGLLERPFPEPENVYGTAESLTEELLYVLNRSSAVHPIGSSLEKPGVILNRWKTGDTELQTKSLDAPMPKPAPVSAGTPFGATGGALFGAPPRMAKMARVSMPMPVGSSYDFLAEAGLVITNVSPDSEGNVQLDLPQSANPRIITIMAADYKSSALRSFPLPSSVEETKQAATSRDLRLRLEWPLDAHVVESNTVVALKSGDRVSVSGRFPAIVSTCRKMFDIAEALALGSDKSVFAEFRFISRWAGMSLQEKLKLYDQYACHELNLLLHAKDAEFANNIIKPYIADKVEKTVVDYYILGDVEACRKYLVEPWRVEKLNAVERLMAAKLVGDDVLTKTRKWAADGARDAELAVSAAERAKQRDLLFRTVTAGSEEEAAEGNAGEEHLRKRRKQGRVKHTFRVSSPAYLSCSPAYSPTSPDADAMMIEGEAAWDDDEDEESDEDMGFGLMDDVPSRRDRERERDVRFSATFGAAPPPPPPAMSAAPGFGGFGAQQQQQVAQALQSNVQNVLLRGDRLDDLQSRSEDLAAQAQQFSSAGKKSKRAMQAAFYEAPESTSAWAERQYWNNSEVSISLNNFWKEWVEHDGGAFISENFGEALTSGFTEAVFAMAFTDLPFTEASQVVEVDGSGGSGFKIEAKSPAILFFKEMKTIEAKPLASIILSQEYFDPQNRQALDADTNEYYDRYVDMAHAELLPGKVYGCRISVTNTSSINHLLSPLVQIPTGALPVEGQAIKTHRLVLAPFKTHLLEYKFYFPQEGTYDHYPVQVSKSGYVIAHAPATKLLVSWPKPDAAVPEDVMKTWEWVASRQATVDQLVSWLKAPSSRLPGFYGDILWRCKDLKAWRRIVDALKERGVFAADVWSYAVRHKALSESLEWLNFEEQAVQLLGEAPYFAGGGVVWDAFERKRDNVKEYWPLINARAHQLGKRPRVNNADFLKAYSSFLEYLIHKPASAQTAGDHLMIACQLILQDRIAEAQTRVQCLLSEVRAGKLRVTHNLQLDYALAWLDLVDSEGNLHEARRVAQAHFDCPIPRWRNLFREVRHLIAELDKAEGGVVPMDVDEEGEASTREARAARRGNGEPRLEFEVEKGKLRLSHANLVKCEVLFHPINLETEFSARPFELASTASAAQLDSSEEKSPALYILSKHHTTLDLPTEGGDLLLEVPKSFRGGTCLVEMVANEGDIVKSRVWARSNLSVEVQHRNGLVKVLATVGDSVAVDAGKSKQEEDEWSLIPFSTYETTSLDVSTAKSTVWKPLPRCYVKVYAKIRGEGVVFYKDGYTDRLGRFDYAGLSNTELLKKAEKFAVLCVGPGEGDGGVVVEAKVPKV